MKHLFSKLLMPVIALTVVSCSNQEEPIQKADTRATNTSVTEILNITYKGKCYKSIPTTYDENGEFVFLNDEFATLYSTEIAMLPDLSIFVSDANNIEFYSSLNETLEKKELKLIKNVKFNSVLTRVGGIVGEVDLFDDTGCKDRHFPFTITENSPINYIADLKPSPYKFNDKCSSLTLANNLPDVHNQTILIDGKSLPCADVSVVFIGYDDKNYTDRTIVCTAESSRYNTYNSLPGFNDKLSSFKLFLAKDGQYYTHF